MIVGSTQGLIRARSLDVLHLLRYRADVTFASCSEFFRRGAGADTAIAAIVADAGRVVVDDGGVVDVVNLRDVDVVDAAIVVEVVVFPAASFIAMAKIAEAVVDASVKTDHRSPIAFVEGKGSSIPSPVAGCPKVAGLRRKNPGAGYPEVVAGIRVPGPISRGPDVPVTRTQRLFVDG